jgi:hypothetical protein
MIFYSILRKKDHILDKIHGSNLNKDDLTGKALSRLQTERKKQLKKISDKIKDDPGPIGLHKSDIDAIHQVFDQSINVVSNTFDDNCGLYSIEHIKYHIPLMTKMMEEHGELRQLQEKIAELEANQYKQLLNLKLKAIQDISVNGSNIEDITNSYLKAKREKEKSFSLQKDILISKSKNIQQAFISNMKKNSHLNLRSEPSFLDDENTS